MRDKYQGTTLVVPERLLSRGNGREEASEFRSADHDCLRLRGDRGVSASSGLLAIRGPSGRREPSEFGAQLPGSPARAGVARDGVEVLVLERSALKNGSDLVDLSLPALAGN